IAPAEIESREIPHHQGEAFRRWLVEAELLFQLLDEIRIEPLRSPIFRVDDICGGARGTARAEIALAAGNTRGAAGVGAGKLRDDALDRSARRELDDQEGDEENSEQRRNHQ